MPSNAFAEVLICVSGSTPQIVTETIYGLAMQNPPVQADEIYIITTSFGKRQIEETLVKKGILNRLTGEYGLHGPAIKQSSFVIIKDHEGNEIDDIRTEEENSLTGDLIASLVRTLAQDSGTRLHCCLAGGRKTMSFYLGAALQLFGRPWDKLYHVLVTPEFESRPEFFYKPRENKVIEWKMQDGSTKRLNTDDSEVILTELPFIRLWNKLELQGKSFGELVAEGQAELDTAIVQPDLAVNLTERTVRIGAHVIEMVPVQLMLYLAFLRQKAERCTRPEQPYCNDCTDCFVTLGEMVTNQALARMGTDYEAIYGGSPGKAGELLEHWKGNDGIRVIRQNRSKINGAIREALSNTPLASRYIIDSIKRYGDTRYGVRAEKGKIEIRIR
ncbi:MAG: CRISPR-associated protein (Cas_NE0113) [Syntrophorhabdaceae bacterium PtaU1.Bin034]|jgi:CRISPR-associated protein Csx14|nr:MAG: CRISPR-associated protein (Cas_NE0113) [Syntrophorhabdaceae bacterium PtaU1.Bin034]